MNCFLVTLALMTHLQAGNIVPGPYPVAPQGFDQRVESVPHGKLEMVDYSSKTVGTVRHMMVYTPPGYSKKNHYPVLYLLHGIGGTEREWVDNGHPENILDNLYAQHRLTPMIVVFPMDAPKRTTGPKAISTPTPRPSKILNLI